MFENEPNGYKRSEVDYYLKQLDNDFNAIIKSHSDRLENVKHNIADLAREITEYTQVIPQYKNINESLRERLENIRGWAESASKARYLPNNDPDAVLANLISQILNESDNIDELKPVIPKKQKLVDSDELFEVLASSRDIKMEDAFRGFDFYDNNPYRASAEKRLANIEKKKQKGRA